MLRSSSLLISIRVSPFITWKYVEVKGLHFSVGWPGKTIIRDESGRLYLEMNVCAVTDRCLCVKCFK